MLTELYIISHTVTSDLNYTFLAANILNWCLPVLAKITFPALRCKIFPCTFSQWQNFMWGPVTICKLGGPSWVEFGVVFRGVLGKKWVRGLPLVNYTNQASLNVILCIFRLSKQILASTIHIFVQYMLVLCNNIVLQLNFNRGYHCPNINGNTV